MYWNFHWAHLFVLLLQPIVKSCLTLEESLSMMEKCIVAPAMANSLVPKDMDLAVGLERFPWMMAKAIRYKYPISQPQKHRNFNHFKKYFWRMSLHNEFFTNHCGQKFILLWIFFVSNQNKHFDLTEIIQPFELNFFFREKGDFFGTFYITMEFSFRCERKCPLWTIATPKIYTRTQFWDCNLSRMM